MLPRLFSTLVILQLSACTTFSGVETSRTSGASGGGGEEGAGAGGGTAGGAGGSSNTLGGQGGSAGSAAGGSAGTASSGPCVDASGCDDKNPCTQDACLDGFCKFTVQAGVSCSDGDKCNGEETCNASGQCAPGTPLPVDDGKVCTTDLCDPATGTVSHKGQEDCSCASDLDCDDGNPCTLDTCKVDTCDYQDVPAGGACDDKNACTTGDKCDASGKCSGSSKNVDDGNPCTKDECDPATGNALHPPAPGQSCSDNDACSLGDLCDASGKCVGVQKSVDDANECTTDACDKATGNVSHSPVTGCKPCEKDLDCSDNNPCTNDVCTGGKCAYSNAQVGTSCSDGNACTTGDKCDASGKCAGSPKNVDDGNPCTTDACDPATGNASHAPSSGASCNDGDACSLGDQCDQGACKGTQKNVDDANECTTDACDKATGNVSHTPLPNCKPCQTSSDCNDNNPCTTESCNGGKCAYGNASNTTSCDDGNACTTGDKCDGSGKCAGSPKSCGSPPGPCFQSAGTCNPADGQCSYPLAANGTSCSDSNACTLNDACTNGTCVPGAAKTCTPPNNQCYQAAGTCNTSDGSCSFTKKAAGTACDDGNKCATGDTCDSNGTCTPGPAAVSCNSPPNSQCYQAGVCTPATGACSYAPKSAGSACDDGNACTSSDVCGSNLQCGGSAIAGCQSCSSSSDCNDSNPCTNDSCVSGKCAYSNNTAACDDGNACTTGDTCSGGSCVPGTAKSCPTIPNTDCFEAVGSCNPADGQCNYPNKPNGTSCNDELFCTTNDKCYGGVCDGTPKSNCQEP